MLLLGKANSAEVVTLLLHNLSGPCTAVSPADHGLSEGSDCLK